MTFTFITLFPSIIESYTSASIFGRGREKDLIRARAVNLRDFAEDAHKTCDDAPYGGGSGMVLMAEVLDRAIRALKTPRARIVFPTPAAPLFTQQDARELSREEEIIFICGRYEGVDERIVEEHVHKVFSIGEYVLSSGELASLVIADAVSRLIGGVITGASLDEESYNDGLLEYPHYTRPAVFNGRAVPPVLLSGNHEQVRTWRQEQRIERTKLHRPDLHARYAASHPQPEAHAPKKNSKTNSKTNSKAAPKNAGHSTSSNPDKNK